MPGRIVLAMDLAGRAGAAWGPVGGRPEATAIDLGRAKGEGERLAEMLRATETLLSTVRPEILAYEAPVGGPKTSHFLVALVGCFVGQATLMGYKPRSVAIASVRKHFLGRALSTSDFPGMTKAQAKEAIKATVITRCGALGWKPRNHDEADAMALFDFACAHYGRGQSAPLGGLFDQREDAA